MKIKKLTDKECLDTFIDLLTNRVTMNTAFVEDDKGNLTHQVVQVSCGKFVSVSQPEELKAPLRPSTGAELGATVN